MLQQQHNQQQQQPQLAKAQLFDLTINFLLDNVTEIMYATSLVDFGASSFPQQRSPPRRVVDIDYIIWMWISHSTAAEVWDIDQLGSEILSEILSEITTPGGSCIETDKPGGATRILVLLPRTLCHVCGAAAAGVGRW